MRPACATFRICLVASFIESIFSQSFHLIKVGDTGSFFDPQTITARTGDIVTFQWTGMFHSVTQSSFDNPCTPLQGGFDSAVTGNPPLRLTLPEWNLTITDDTQPIWYFCKVTVPVSHCTNGMVGAINANIASGNQSFNSFDTNAKLLTNPPTLPTVAPILTGVGAVATNTPIPITNISNVTSTMATSTSTSLDNSSITSPPASSSAATAIPPQNDASTSSGLSAGLKGAIAGGSVGGVLLVVLLALLFMSYRRGRRYRKEAEATKMIRSQSSRDMSQLTRLDLNDDAHSYYPPHTAAQLVDVHRSQGSMSVAGSLEPESTTSPSFNVRDLAAEIAKNIRQEMNPQDHTGPQQDGTSLATVPEQVVEKAVSRAELARRAEATRGPESTSGVESTRGSESTRGTEYTRRTESVRGRQLPRPPTRADVRSVDTLPAYAPGPR